MPFLDLTPIAFIRLQTLTYSQNMPVFGFNKCRIANISMPPIFLVVK